jgi:HSP20 family protein
MPHNLPFTIRRILTSTLAAADVQTWQPPVDVYRVAGGWLLKFELAGVSPDDMTVTLQGSRVIVRGVRLDRCLESGCSVHQMEIAYNVFERTIELPDDLSHATLRWESSFGMLIVRITLESAA